MVKIVRTEEEKELIEEINSGTFRTYEGWKRKGRVVMKGEEATLTTKVEGISIYLFSKDQTTKVKRRDDYGTGYGDRSGYDDYGYDGDVDSLYGM